MPEYRATIPDVEDALYDALLAELEDDEPEVGCSLGYPDGGPKDEQVWVGGEPEYENGRPLTGYGLRDEDGTVKVYALITWDDGPTCTYKAVRDRAYELGGYLEDAVGADPTLDGLVDEARVSGGKGEYALPGGRRQYLLTLTVTYSSCATARLG